MRKRAFKRLSEQWRKDPIQVLVVGIVVTTQIVEAVVLSSITFGGRKNRTR